MRGQLRESEWSLRCITPQSLNNPPVFIRVLVDIVTQYVKNDDANALSTYVQKWCPDFLNATYA